jgi:hypothetical protein
MLLSDRLLVYRNFWPLLHYGCWRTYYHNTLSQNDNNERIYVMYWTPRVVWPLLTQTSRRLPGIAVLLLCLVLGREWTCLGALHGPCSGGEHNQRQWTTLTELWILFTQFHFSLIHGYYCWLIFVPRVTLHVFLACMESSTPRLVGESLLHSVVGITNVAQKVRTLPLILNLSGGRNFGKSYD